MLLIEVKKLSEAARIPKFGNPGDAGADLCYLGEDVILNPGQKKLLSTGLAVAVPTGYEMQIRPRSGLAAKHGITVLNTPGTVDSGYRGELKVILVNLSSIPYTVRNEDRIAQAVINKLPEVGYCVVEELDATDRGEEGFGSTGR